jgi:hypothetical protein
MAEDAFGYVGRDNGPGKSLEKARKQILIMDDINRGGDAMEWIMKDWQSSCLPNSEAWDEVWHENVRFASLISDPNSIVDTDYWSEELSEDENWVEFPWET